MMPGARYFRLFYAFARYGLARELAFRGNFVIKMAVEVLWLSILLVFYRTVFTKTSVVAGWTEPEYLFFVGCYFALEGMMETLFLENCSEFSELVRNGTLDFYLLQPIDEQFLISCRNIEWSSAPNLIIGSALMWISAAQMHLPFDALKIFLFVGLFGCGLAIAYSFLLMLSATSVWLVRNQSLYELWWLFTSLMRYPKEIFMGPWASPMGFFFTFIVPVLLVVNVPAHTMVKVFNPWLVGFMVATAIVLVTVSRRFLIYSLRRYRSASS